MRYNIPSAADLAAKLVPMQTRQLMLLQHLSGVPYHTILKIRGGQSANPRLDTVRRLAPHLTAAAKSRA
jgi:hypothetical protein